MSKKRKIKKIENEIASIPGAVFGTQEPLFYVAAPGHGVHIFEGLINALLRAGVCSEMLLDVKNDNALVRFGITKREKKIVKNCKI